MLRATVPDLEGASGATKSSAEIWRRLVRAALTVDATADVAVVVVVAEAAALAVADVVATATGLRIRVPRLINSHDPWLSDLFPTEPENTRGVGAHRTAGARSTGLYLFFHSCLNCMTIEKGADLPMAGRCYGCFEEARKLRRRFLKVVCVCVFVCVPGLGTGSDVEFSAGGFT